jgi:hypothetical protein
MTSIVLADALLEKFGSDSVGEIEAAMTRQRAELADRLAARVGPA